MRYLILLLLALLCYFYYQSQKCAPPSGIVKNIQSIEQVAFDIIKHKSEILPQERDHKSSGYRFALGENQLPTNLRHIDSICLANGIPSFFISKEVGGEITFHLDAESNFFQGIITTKQLFFSTTDSPNTTYEDGQIKNKCCIKLTNTIWYIVDEESN